MKKLISFAITATITLVTATTAFAQTFTDVPTNHWAYSSIEKAVDNGVVKGVGNGKYEPNKNVTYGEWSVMVSNIFFNGLSKDGYNPKVWWAGDNYWMLECKFYDNTQYRKLHNSISDYTNTDVSKTINRYEMAQVIYNIQSCPGAEHFFHLDNVNTNGIANKISDYKAIPSQYRDAVEFCYASGLITGVDNNGTFAGTQPVTRASSAVILSRLMDAKAGKWVVPIQ